MPSRALFQLVKEGNERFLWFDTCYAVRSAVVRLHEEWGWLERQRATGLSNLLDAMRERLEAATDDPVARRMIAVANVTDALLGYPKACTDVQRQELAEVHAGKAGTMRFASPGAACDWSVTRPVGGYGRLAPRPGKHDELAGVFRATAYLRIYLAGWPAKTRARWIELARACRKAGKAEQLGITDEAMRALFGAGTIAPGVPQPGVAFDIAWLRARRAEAGLAHDVLPALFAATPRSEGGAVSDGVLRLCRALAVAPTADALLAGMQPAQWRAKWQDAAQFAYVGLREVDCALRAVGIEQLPSVPRVLVEPLPEVWRALRWLDLRAQQLLRVTRPGWQHGSIEGSWIDDVLEALRLQQRGEPLPEELNLRLVETLLYSFSEPDRLLGTVSHVEGVATPLRRAVPQFVRIPIHWQGKTEQVLALRLFVEQQSPAGDWQPPPWGVGLDPRGLPPSMPEKAPTGNDK